jgi:hypothetical protein
MAYGMITDEFLSRNYQKFVNNTSDAGRELVVKVSRDGTALTHADLLKAYAQLTQAGGDGTGFDQNGPDAGSFAALGTADGSPFVSGTTTEVFVRLQTTGTPNTADIVVDGNDIEFDVVAVFAPRF